MDTIQTITLARRVLAGEASVPEPAAALKLVGDLKGLKEFSLARRLLALVRAAVSADSLPPKLRRKLRQQHALCTYKDSDLAIGSALDRAMAVLGDDPADEELATTTDPETLGIAGAIAKRCWEEDGKLDHLWQSAGYYQRGWEQGMGDDGYTGINAAFVLDRIAGELDDGGAAAALSASAAALRGQADTIRRTILDALDARFRADGGCSWWSAVTAAEAALGLGAWNAAECWFTRAKALPDVPDWEWESTVRQSTALIRRRFGDTETEAPAAYRVLANFAAGKLAPDALPALAGKVGLALSGGGYRAALFHIGVLARLAELDLLRHVEVLSCVSGGSIVGAAYYLRLRALLETCPDAAITQDHYIALVNDLIADFRVLTRRDGRTYAFIMGAVHPLKSRTQMMATVLEDRLYRRITGTPGPTALRSLKIQPAGHDGPFHPRRNNWTRRNKAPVLILNATTLNTAHNWQFTASWMGEPPASIDPAIDATERLRRMYYDEAPGPHGNITLGLAVAASAAVPLLFPALTLKGLYPDRTVQLADGGVYDNQGLFGLTEQDCTCLLVSDASGHLEAQAHPWRGLPGVAFRLTDLLMDAVRRGGYRLQRWRQQTSRQRQLVFVHMKMSLKGEAVGWINAPPMDAAGPAPVAPASPLSPDIQRLLAAVRTDLDCFSQREALCLMVAGYRLATAAGSRTLDASRLARERKVRWSFLGIENPMVTETPERATLASHLALGSHLFGRGVRSWIAKWAKRGAQ